MGHPKKTLENNEKSLLRIFGTIFRWDCCGFLDPPKNSLVFSSVSAQMGRSSYMGGGLIHRSSRDFFRLQVISWVLVPWWKVDIGQVLWRSWRPCRNLPCRPLFPLERVWGLIVFWKVFFVDFSGSSEGTKPAGKWPKLLCQERLWGDFFLLFQTNLFLNWWNETRWFGSWGIPLEALLFLG